MDKHQQGYMIDIDKLPKNYPTHAHPDKFWECLGRAIATYGYLEDILSRAIFSLSATRRYTNQQDLEKAYESWREKLEQSLSDPMNKLIDKYAKELTLHPQNQLENLKELTDGLKKAAIYRNALCHSSWPLLDKEGKVTPRFFHHKKGKWTTPFDIELLKDCQKNASELSSEVMNSVTLMGYSFPGTDGPGEKIQ